jgi:hypothetical protein
MKFSVAVLIAMPALAAAFVPAQPRAFGMSLNAAPAGTKEEDLELTRKVILKFMDGDAPAEKPAAAPAAAPATEEKEE